MLRRLSQTNIYADCLLNNNVDKKIQHWFDSTGWNKSTSLGMRHCKQGRTGTKSSTGHKPPIGAPTRGVNQKSNMNIFLLISSSGVRQNDRAKRGRKQLGFGGAVSPPMGPGAEPRKIFRFQVSRSPKIDNSMRKVLVLFLVEFVF